MTNARLEELRSKFQENPRRYFAPYANELRKAGDPAQAISVCRTHLATQPGHVSGHIVLGQALYEAGQTHEARDVFSAALELDPENLIALRTLGEISQVDGEFVSARQWYERLLEADPRNSEVAQLLKDLPTENAKSVSETEPVEAHAAETTLEEHREQEQSPFAPPAVVPTFHSGFTGPGPAFKTAEDLAEEERQAMASSQAAEVSQADDTPPALANEPLEFLSMEPAATSFDSEVNAPEPETLSESQQEPDEPATESIDLVDFNAFATDEPVSEPASMSAPDDPSAEAVAPSDFVDFSFTEPAPPDGPTAQLESPVEEEFTPPASDATEEFEQPRALFAEHGFEGPADDQIGWVMTPSAVESDLESAPEDWFDVPAAAQVEEVAASGQPAEPASDPASEASEPDSWFEDVAAANVVAPTEGLTTDEFWLPPDLSQVSFTPVAEAPQTAPEPVIDASAMETEPEPVAEVSAMEPEPEPVAEASAMETEAERVAEAAAMETMVSEPAAEQVIESPVSYVAAEAFPEAVDPASAMEPSAAELEPEGSETAYSTIEYFDHGGSSQQETRDEAPAAEWPEPLAHYEPEQSEPSAESVGEQPADTSYAWEAEAHEASPADSFDPFATQPVDFMEPSDAEPFEPVQEIVASGSVIESPESVEAGSVMEASEPVDAEHDMAPSSTAELAGEFAMASDVPDEPTFAEPPVSFAPPVPEPVAHASPEPFVTETLAELYLQQGFRDEALTISRQLSERDPSNTPLRDRISYIENAITEKLSAVPQVAAIDRSGSQSVRTFFSKLARRPAVGPGSQHMQSAESASQPDVPFSSAASALANLFAASKPSAADEGAAATLAGVYTNPAGRPSRAADRELSLDHLFRDVPPGGSPSGGMSLDEFYSTPNAEQGSPTEPGEASESPESGGADIRQFTAWLEGLRKK